MEIHVSRVFMCMHLDMTFLLNEFVILSEADYREESGVFRFPSL